MAYSTINKSTDYFNTVTYTGSAGGQTISGVGHQPDFIWVKQRGDAGYAHSLHDSVTGLLKQLISNTNAAQITNTDTVTSNNADGFVLGADTAGPSANSNNQDGKNYVAWNWKANGQGSANTDGSINTTYTSASTAAGFSISKYTGTGANATVGHGLGVAPRMYICKSLSSTRSWAVYHEDIGNTKALFLDTAAAVDTDATYWNSTSPTNSVVSLGSRSEMNHSGEDFIMYCFAEKTGYSKIGSYTGTGSSDGAFVYTGFKPTFLIFKNAGVGSESWEMFDTKRDNINVSYKGMLPNSDSAELTNTAQGLDILSNGFKPRANENRFNDDQNTTIYMAFGQTLVGSNNIPATAR